MEKWLCFLTGKDNDLPMNDMEKDKMMHYGVSMMEVIWMEKNGIKESNRRTGMTYILLLPRCVKTVLGC